MSAISDKEVIAPGYSTQEMTDSVRYGGHSSKPCYVYLAPHAIEPRFKVEETGLQSQALCSHSSSLIPLIAPYMNP